MKNKFAFAIFLTIPLIIVVSLRLYLNISFDINCKDYLKRAADANTVETASAEMDKSIKYLEDHNLTTGFTSVLWREPSEDIAFFYNNLKSAREELAKVNSTTTQLERTNILMKLRETLLDHKGKEGDEVTCPNGLSRYPNNTGFFIAGWVTGLFALFGWLQLFKELG